MSESISLITLFVVTILSHNPCIDVSARQYSSSVLNEDGLDDNVEERKLPLDNILHNAMIVLALSLAVASSLSPSSLNLAL